MALSPPAIRVRIVRDEGDRELTYLQDEMLISEPMAIMRGVFELNKEYYKSQKLTVECTTALLTGIKDGDVVLINSSRYGISGHYIVKSREIEVSNAGVNETLNVERYVKS